MSFIQKLLFPQINTLHDYFQTQEEFEKKYKQIDQSPSYNPHYMGYLKTTHQYVGNVNLTFHSWKQLIPYGLTAVVATLGLAVIGIYALGIIGFTGTAAKTALVALSILTFSTYSRALINTPKTGRAIYIAKPEFLAKSDFERMRDVFNAAAASNIKCDDALIKAGGFPLLEGKYLLPDFRTKEKKDLTVDELKIAIDVSFASCYRAFRYLRGNVLPITNIILAYTQKVSIPKHTKIALNQRMRTYCVCREGRHRSQLTYHILARMYPHLPLASPHGVKIGADVIIFPPSTWTAERVFKAATEGSEDFYPMVEFVQNHQNTEKEKDLRSKAETDKGVPMDAMPLRPRIGEEKSPESLAARQFFPSGGIDMQPVPPLEEVRKYLDSIPARRSFMSRILFDLLVDEGQIIAYASGIHGMFFRIAERAAVLGRNLTETTLIPMNSDDPFTARIGTCARDFIKQIEDIFG